MTHIVKAIHEILFFENIKNVLQGVKAQNTFSFISLSIMPGKIRDLQRMYIFAFPLQSTKKKMNGMEDEGPVISDTWPMRIQNLNKLTNQIIRILHLSEKLVKTIPSGEITGLWQPSVHSDVAF
jgi:hypothetical protein